MKIQLPSKFPWKSSCEPLRVHEPQVENHCPRGFQKYLVFFGNNFGPRNARKLIKGSQDSYYSLKSNKTLSHKIRLLDQLTSSKKTQNLPQS